MRSPAAPGRAVARHGGRGRDPDRAGRAGPRRAGPGGRAAVAGGAAARCGPPVTARTRPTSRSTCGGRPGGDADRRRGGERRCNGSTAASRCIPSPACRGGPLVAVVLVLIDLANWASHVSNHRVDAFWRFHALHHSQEEMSILTSFRAHPLVHTSFQLTAVPLIVLGTGGAVPATVLVGYVVLSTHAARQRRLGLRPVALRDRQPGIPPAAPRPRPTGAGVNLGTVLVLWDVLAGLAVFPGRDGASAAGDGRRGWPAGRCRWSRKPAPGWSRPWGGSCGRPSGAAAGVRAVEAVGVVEVGGAARNRCGRSDWRERPMARWLGGTVPAAGATWWHSVRWWRQPSS